MTQYRRSILVISKIARLVSGEFEFHKKKIISGSVWKLTVQATVDCNRRRNRDKQ